MLVVPSIPMTLNIEMKNETYSPFLQSVPSQTARHSTPTYLSRYWKGTGSTHPEQQSLSPFCACCLPLIDYCDICLLSHSTHSAHVAPFPPNTSNADPIVKSILPLLTSFTSSKSLTVLAPPAYVTGMVHQSANLAIRSRSTPACRPSLSAA